MKYEHMRTECPYCGFVMKVLYVPWPYTGEWLVYEHPRYCSHCGARLPDSGRYDAKEDAWRSPR